MGFFSLIFFFRSSSTSETRSRDTESFTCGTFSNFHPSSSSAMFAIFLMRSWPLIVVRSFSTSTPAASRAEKMPTSLTVSSRSRPKIFLQKSVFEVAFHFPSWSISILFAPSLFRILSAGIPKYCEIKGISFSLSISRSLAITCPSICFSTSLGL